MAIHLSGGAAFLALVAILFFPAVIAAYLLKDPKWLLIVPPSLVALWLVHCFTYRGRNVKPEQWAAELEPLLLGTAGPWGWDDATGVKLADPRLEAIRIKLVEFGPTMSEQRRIEFQRIIAALKCGEMPALDDQGPKPRDRRLK